MRVNQLMLRVMSPGRIHNGQDVQTFMNKWEGKVNAMVRDFWEVVIDPRKIGILIRMMPDELQDVILQHADSVRNASLSRKRR